MTTFLICSSSLEINVADSQNFGNKGYTCLLNNIVFEGDGDDDGDYDYAPAA